MLVNDFLFFLFFWDTCNGRNLASLVFYGAIQADEWESFYVE